MRPKPYQIRLLTGASISAAADDVLSDADAVSGVRHIKHRPVYVKDQSGRGEFR